MGSIGTLEARVYRWGLDDLPSLMRGKTAWPSRDGEAVFER